MHPTTRTRRLVAGIVIGLVLLAATVIASLTLGARPIDPAMVWDVLSGRVSGTDEATTIMTLRVPRTLIGIAAGIGFGIAGALTQALTRNPLADPGILGVNSGAAFAVTLAVGVFGITGAGAYLPFAFAGAFIAAVVVFVIGGLGPSGSPARVTLMGVALGAVLAGIVSALTLANDRVFSAIQAWNSGSLAMRTAEQLIIALPFLVVGVALAAVMTRSLNALAMGDDTARSIGVSLGRVRALVLTAITLLAGASTAIAGPIAFIGLMIPHLARLIAGVDERRILALTLVYSPALLLGADTVGRLLLTSGEVPAGLVCSALGAPVLIIIARNPKLVRL